MNVRDATTKDYNKMSYLFKQIDGIHSEAHPDIFNEPIDNVRSKKYLKKSIQNDKEKLIVAVEDDVIVGLAMAEINSSQDFPLFVKREWLAINIIVVDEKHRGKGIGKKLLVRLYNWAKMNEVDDAELTVYTFNESALNFYKRNGFKDVRIKMSKKMDDYK